MSDIEDILRYVASGEQCSEAQGDRIIAIQEVDKNLARRIVRASLEAQGGNWTSAAKQLSVGRRTLWRWKEKNDWHDIGFGLPNAKLGRVVE